jgi:hypothetical protein
MITPVSLTDAQLAAISEAATPLQPFDRSAFLASVDNRLAAEYDPGDGTVARIIREVLHTGLYRRSMAL